MVRFLLKGFQSVLPINFCHLRSGRLFVFKNCHQKLLLTQVMEESTLSPPPSVRGMKKLDKEFFRKDITVPCLLLPLDKIVFAKQVLKPYLLKLQNFRPIQDYEKGVASNLTLPSNWEEKVNCPVKIAVLNPKVVTNFNDFNQEDKICLSKIELNENHIINCRYTLVYDNWKADEILRAIIPLEYDSVSGYSLCGHIIHLNLRDHLMDYKQIIADILLDKVKCARTVVNKTDNIDTTFRTFSMEVLTGDPCMITTVKENKCKFVFDFSKVYWNPRLSTEHERLVSILKKGDVLYDVFCGVGPFAIPARIKGCRVLANDLNPESVKWLNESMKLNKVTGIDIFNKDASDFIKEDVRRDLLELNKFDRSVHIVMNLPAMASTFLVHFRGLFSAEELDKIPPLRVHVFCFTKGVENPEAEAIRLVENDVGDTLQGNYTVSFVRNVAPLKEMMRVSFTLTEKVLSSHKRLSESSPPTKRLHTC